MRSTIVGTRYVPYGVYRFVNIENRLSNEKTREHYRCNPIVEREHRFVVGSIRLYGRDSTSVGANFI